MGSVLSFADARQARFKSFAPTLLESFGSFRNDRLNVMWLKENAELLNVFEATNCTVEQEDLSPLVPFYEGSLRHLKFFRQYYRFILSICLDLEDLGLPGDCGERLVGWVAQQHVAELELSDLQRAEARRLLARRGVELPGTDGLDDRLWSFMRRSAQFAVPNRKAAYELTHIVFYLSEYGRRPLALDPDSLQSLHFVGLMAFLDQDEDLLAEVALCLRFCNEPVPQAWSDWIIHQAGRFTIQPVDVFSGGDSYHPYLMCNWFLRHTGQEGFFGPLCEGSFSVERPRAASALQGVSMALYSMFDQKLRSWPVFRGALLQGLTVQDKEIFQQAESSSPAFEAFFESFSRMENVKIA